LTHGTPRATSCTVPKQKQSVAARRNGKVAATEIQKSGRKNGLPEGISKVLDLTGQELPRPDEQHYDSVIDPARVWRYKLTRFNPVRNLTPDVLATQIEDFRIGYLRYLALTMEAVAERDETLASVIPKRRFDISSCRWEIMAVEGADPGEAEKHKQALRFFYENAQATHAVDLNQRRGVSLLFEQMINARLYKYATHEILWRPSSDGLTAVFNFVPLYFFENRTGKMRFLLNDFDFYGVDLADGGWMITAGECLMIPCVIAYLFKAMALKSWVLYCEKQGTPGVHGKTKSAKGTPEWESFKDAVAALAADFSAVTSIDDVIEKIDLAAAGTLPFPALIEEMKRAMMTIWRGADLSTLSAQGGEGQGASLQEKETHAIRQGDGKLITETLNLQVDPQVIAWNFGEGVRPLAYVKVVVPPLVDVNKEIAIDNHLEAHGVPVSVNGALDRLGRAAAADDEEVLQPVVTPEAPAPKGEDELGNIANESHETRQLLGSAIEKLKHLDARTVAPLMDRLAGIAEITNEKLFRAAVEQFQRDLPSELSAIPAGPAADLFSNTLGAALLNGMAEGKAARHESESQHRVKLLVDVEERNKVKPTRTVQFHHDSNGRIIGAKVMEEQQNN